LLFVEITCIDARVKIKIIVRGGDVAHAAYCVKKLKCKKLPMVEGPEERVFSVKNYLVKNARVKNRVGGVGGGAGERRKNAL
jgi:hypothetical protein